MASPPAHAYTSWHVEHATSLTEIWVRIAVFSGPVGAWRLTGVCRAAREGAKGHLRSLPRLVVVCGHRVMATGMVSEVWRLDMASLQWESMSALVTARVYHACCAVRGSVAVIGGRALVGNQLTTTASVEALSSGEGGAFVSLPPLSCGEIYGAATITVEESDSTAGQVLLLGGSDSSYLHPLCTPQPHLLRGRAYLATARLPDGRVVCAGGIGGDVLSSAEILGPPGQGAQDAAWSRTELPVMSTARYRCSGCVMRDGRFAVLGGTPGAIDEPLSSCEALTFVDNMH